MKEKNRTGGEWERWTYQCLKSKIQPATQTLTMNCSTTQDKKLQEKGNEYTGNYELDGVYAYGREAMKSLTKIVISGLQWRKKKNAKGERVWKIWRKWKEVREWKDYRETYREVCKGKEVINEKHIRKRKLWNENYKWSRNEMKSLWVKENYRMRSL